MLSIRLQRVGRRHDPTFRIVATDSRSGPKTNKHCAILGSYDTIRKSTIISNPEKIQEYISHGAKITDTVYNIFVNEGIIEGKKKNPLPKKSPIVDEEALAREAEEKAAAEQAAAEAAAQAEEPAQEDAVEEASEEEATEAPETTEEAPIEDAAQAEEATEEAESDDVSAEASAEEEVSAETSAEEEEKKED